MLRTYLPAPPQLDEDEFYACLTCYAADIDLAAWDSAAFAKAMQERIVAPGARAVAQLQRWPYLSRLLTIISPHEMTVDPEFIANPDLPDVAAARVATLNVPCAGSGKMDLPDGRSVLLHTDRTWPRFDDSMPWAARVEQMAPSGAPQVLQDFSAAIDAALRASNRRYQYDDGTGVGCTAGQGTYTGPLVLAVVFGVAWRGRRRRVTAAGPA